MQYVILKHSGLLWPTGKNVFQSGVLHIFGLAKKISDFPSLKSDSSGFSVDVFDLELENMYFDL